MIDVQLMSIIAVVIESIGILIAEKKTAFFLGLATIITIILFFMT